MPPHTLHFLTQCMPGFDDGELMSYGHEAEFGDLLGVDTGTQACHPNWHAELDLDMGELIPSTPCPAPTSLMTESLTLVPYGQHTLAIPTSMVTPELLAHLASMSAAPIKAQQPTVTEATDASHATTTPTSTRLAQLGMKLNALLSDEQRKQLNVLHRAARDASDAATAADAKQRFWDVWYSAAPRDEVDELRALMTSCEEASTPASATPASSADVVPVTSVSTSVRRPSSDDERDTAAGRKRQKVSSRSVCKHKAAGQ